MKRNYVSLCRLMCPTYIWFTQSGGALFVIFHLFHRGIFMFLRCRGWLWRNFCFPLAIFSLPGRICIDPKGNVRHDEFQCDMVFRGYSPYLQKNKNHLLEEIWVARDCRLERAVRAGPRLLCKYVSIWIVYWFEHSNRVLGDNPFIFIDRSFYFMIFV